METIVLSGVKPTRKPAGKPRPGEMAERIGLPENAPLLAAVERSGFWVALLIDAPSGSW
jgi:hypothetical protein